MRIQQRVLVGVALVLTGLWVPVRCLGDGIDLSQMQDWDIVVSEDAIPSEQYAAQEFQDHYHRAAGVRLAIVSTVDRLARHVFIGSGRAMQESSAGFDATKLPEEDLRIVVRDDNIAIAGGPPRGTLYGVYQFLERRSRPELDTSYPLLT